MKLTTMLGAAVVGMVLMTPATQATDWVNISQPPAIKSASELNASFAPTYLDGGQNFVNTDVEPAFQNAAAPIDRLTLAKTEISGYANLQEDWDGYGASAPHSDHVRDSIAFLDRLPGGIAIPTPMIGTSGQIGLYWDMPALYADIAFEGAGALSIFVKNKETAEEKFASVDDLHTLSQDWFAQMLGRGQNA
ncbi:hypothetical protein [Paraburkholderia bryophila]|uniref:Uncharacterized protein n=1 Tax=Paraburkholderia bryophila TaxID=420952 RepID=A0A7Y9W461_9BURK|nr:hypothetical protein [Paraburkholderia bryophila]NYH13410.1 hypothetical protein [Paraburkholderia bryophila]